MREYSVYIFHWIIIITHAFMLNEVFTIYRYYKQLDYSLLRFIFSTFAPDLYKSNWLNALGYIGFTGFVKVNVLLEKLKGTFRFLKPLLTPYKHILCTTILQCSYTSLAELHCSFDEAFHSCILLSQGGAPLWSETTTLFRFSMNRGDVFRRGCRTGASSSSSHRDADGEFSLRGALPLCQPSKD